MFIFLSSSIKKVKLLVLFTLPSETNPCILSLSSFQKCEIRSVNNFYTANCKQKIKWA